MPLSFAFVGQSRAGTEIAERLAAAGFPAAATVESADAVVSFCLRQSDLEDAYFESGGAIALARPGAYVIDCSPSTPSFGRELSAIALVNGLHPVEAPLVVRDVMLPGAYAESDNLVALAAGEHADFEAVSPLLEAIAETVRYCGQAGAGHMAQCVLTMQRSAQLVSLAESAALADRKPAGDDAADPVRIALEEDLVSPQVARLYSAMLEEDYREGCSYTVETLCGELEAALSAADDAELVTPHADAARYLLQLLAIVGGSQLPASAVRLAYADDETGARYGLDWGRARSGGFAGGEDGECGEDGAYGDYGDYDDYDDYDGEAGSFDEDGGFSGGRECGCGHGGRREGSRRRGQGGPGSDLFYEGGLSGWSAN